MEAEGVGSHQGFRASACSTSQGTPEWLIASRGLFLECQLMSMCFCSTVPPICLYTSPLILILCSSTPQSLPEQQGLFLEYLHMAKALWKMARVYQQVRGAVL